LGDRGFYGLIGAKIVCCGALLLVLTGVLSLGAITTFLTGNAMVLAGAALVVAVVLVRRRVMHRGATRRQGFTASSQSKPDSRTIPDA
jgi:hypothetical protein